MTTFVLVPGMWLGAWAWQPVVGRLRAAGHEAVPLTLTGVGDRAHLARPDLDRDVHVTDIVNAVHYADLDELVLVGHSYGGMPMRMALDRLGGRVSRAVYVDSGPLPEGVSQFDTGSPEEQARIRAEVGDGHLIAPPAYRSEDDPANLAGLDDSALALLRRLSTPHPFATATAPMRLTGAPQPPTTLLATTFPVDQVRQMIAADHPFFAGVQRDGLDVVGLPTGHYPMFSEPAALAGLLGQLN